MNLRDKFFSVQLREEILNIPEIGDVLVREMTTAEVEAISKKHNVSASSGAFASMPETVIACALDPETKKPIWTPADRDALKKLPPRILLPIMKKVGEMSAQTVEAVEEAEKNSSGDAALSSSLPGSSDQPSPNSASA